MMRNVTFPSGDIVPALGQGTWKMAELPARRAVEIAALRHGIERGLTLIDTAEMYADGGAEELVAEAIAGQRDKVYLVSKAYPWNASATGLARACEASLRRLGTDRLDLYLLHWRGEVPLAETVAAMEKLCARGLIRNWGVSNLDEEDMEDLIAAGGTRCAANQVLYNLTRRGPEFDLLPWLEGRGIPLMAYSPIEQGRLAAHRELADLAAGLELSPAQLALAWVLNRPGTVAIPKAASLAHVEANVAAAGLDLTLHEEVALALDRLFPEPTRRVPLEMI
ncbi:aldo/keto reductase [Paracoccus aminophilus]|uniref:Aldo/keto reductase n=1 Tax=Paracoccus aminophilus JCM 7686 TaxID=1367847 RepID=S5YFR3_PARAH|nr:aldo/keto reductase [Paracoccus aminophilus]AGT10318.1 aldo/keto reductase [Paracoccus aminophilus JCM 7686]